MHGVTVFSAMVLVYMFKNATVCPFRTFVKDVPSWPHIPVFYVEFDVADEHNNFLQPEGKTNENQKQHKKI